MVPADHQYLFHHDVWVAKYPQWSVTVVAVANAEGDDVGLATLGLAKDDETYPVIYGIWVNPGAGQHGIGTQLLVALSAESYHRYGQAPRITAATTAGRAAIGAARRAGARFAD